jgi:CheY-like chemotaxis protein
VVDDSLSVRKVAEKHLIALGYDTVLAVDGLDALEKLRTDDDISAVFTDLEMPRMHGYELIAEIRNSAAFRELPITVVTSRDAEKHRKRAAELGANSYITKPFTREQLAHCLENLISTATVNA